MHYGSFEIHRFYTCLSSEIIVTTKLKCLRNIEGRVAGFIALPLMADEGWEFSFDSEKRIILSKKDGCGITVKVTRMPENLYNDSFMESENVTNPRGKARMIFLGEERGLFREGTEFSYRYVMKPLTTN